MNSQVSPESRPTSVDELDLRVQLATERTLLAWIRTGLALMAFGFVVARFALFLQLAGIAPHPVFQVTSTLIGVAMLVLGIVANFGSALHYRSYFRRIGKQQFGSFTAWSLAGSVAYGSSLIGVFLAIYLLLVDMSRWQG